MFAHDVAYSEIILCSQTLLDVLCASMLSFSLAYVQCSNSFSLLFSFLHRVCVTVPVCLCLCTPFVCKNVWTGQCVPFYCITALPTTHVAHAGVLYTMETRSWQQSGP